ncbi:MAG: hypothetical protein GY836_20485 [Herbaspirillum sp.]|uniref:hypothetical protein n=1 Tax=Herbaspirillum sp. TaxID=1890675 RepID=UPI0025837674|nr:hypothetical protein [Herbaspirillum sp.]MCP4557793.1 hypothetical protein [Herbaspirillum sp.]
MFHKVIINNADTADEKMDREILIKFSGDIVIEKLHQSPYQNNNVNLNIREFCQVEVCKRTYNILGSLDELMDKFNNKIEVKMDTSWWQMANEMVRKISESKD